MSTGLEREFLTETAQYVDSLQTLQAHYRLVYESRFDDNTFSFKRYEDNYLVMNVADRTWRQTTIVFDDREMKRPRQLIISLCEKDKGFTWTRQLDPGFRYPSDVGSIGDTGSVLLEEAKGLNPPRILDHLNSFVAGAPYNGYFKQLAGADSLKAKLKDRLLTVAALNNVVTFDATSKKVQSIEIQSQYKDEVYPRRLYRLNKYIESNGVSFPTEIFTTGKFIMDFDGVKKWVYHDATVSIDPQSLKLNAPIEAHQMTVMIAAGALVTDLIQKKSYQISGIDPLNPDFDLLRDYLDKYIKERVK